MPARKIQILRANSRGAGGGLTSRRVISSINCGGTGHAARRMVREAGRCFAERFGARRPRGKRTFRNASVARDGIAFPAADLRVGGRRRQGWSISCAGNCVPRRQRWEAPSAPTPDSPNQRPMGRWPRDKQTTAGGDTDQRQPRAASSMTVGRAERPYVPSADPHSPREAAWVRWRGYVVPCRVP